MMTRMLSDEDEEEQEGKWTVFKKRFSDRWAVGIQSALQYCLTLSLRPVPTDTVSGRVRQQHGRLGCS